MIEDAFIVDAVAHCYNFSAPNRKIARYCDAVSELLYGQHVVMSPAESPEYILPYERMITEPTKAEWVGPAMFGESQTDVCVYHDVPLWDIFHDGLSPLAEGKRMRELWPSRVALYGGFSPWQPDAFDYIDRALEEDKVLGFKLYPLSIVDGKIRSMPLDDEERYFPILEYMQKRGVKSIAVHKSIPFGPVPLQPFRVDDIDGAAYAFPDLNFEVVHGGFAFLEETALQVSRFPNVVVNLEATAGFMNWAPRKFAEILGMLIAWGAEDRIVWASGCVGLHPRPLIEKFWDFQFPEDLCEQYGFPQITKDMKRKILGENMIRITGYDFKGLRASQQDEFDQQNGMNAPWSAVTRESVPA